MLLFISMQTPEIIVVGGKPYSGKSSVSSALVELDKSGRARHLSIGAQLRAISAGEVASKYSAELADSAETLKNHKPVNKDVSLGVFREFIESEPADIIILDGFPRYPDRMDGFNEAIEEIGAKIIAVVLIDVEDSLVHKRSSSRTQRYKDVVEDSTFIDSRIKDFRNNSFPVIEILSKRYPFYKINGDRPLSENIEDFINIYKENSLVYKSKNQ